VLRYVIHPRHACIPLPAQLKPVAVHIALTSMPLRGFFTARLP
jgi:hypothetical protein